MVVQACAAASCRPRQPHGRAMDLLRVLPLIFYAVLAVCIYSNELLGMDLYSEMASLTAQLTVMIHGATFALRSILVEWS